ncbi:DUF636 domain protein [Penicillium lagena]|uniref:DUF636 domain protein n=1 Tax=Penicillium lagena TaxID=94218 RepID=UPI00253FFBBE|nr:DUF636 domain protein [Penicillium lagena]KAJ5605925.1 DUF636 domain protein [Penicillium lagena]
MAPSVITGSCLCGHIRYEVSRAPVTTLLCHCDNCRKCTGSSFMANSFYSKEQLRIIAGEDVLKVYEDKNQESGRVLSRSFCSNCGSPLFTTSQGIPEGENAVAITSGTMDLEPSKSEWTPLQEFFCQKRRGWLPSLEGTITHDTVPQVL